MRRRGELDRCRLSVVVVHRRVLLRVSPIAAASNKPPRVFEITTAAHLNREPIHRLLADVIQQSMLKDVLDEEILVACEVSANGSAEIDSTSGDSMIAGALVWRFADDGTSFVWCPVVDARFSANSDVIERCLLAELIRRVDGVESWFAQCLLQISQVRERRVLLVNGFEQIARLACLRWSNFKTRDVGDGIDVSCHDDLTHHVYDPLSDTDRFARLIEATWTNSLDCPKLNGRRSGEDALRSHDDGDTSRWWVYQSAGQDVGLALVSKSGASSLSVNYTGVVPSARHKGIGREIIRRIQDHAASKKWTVNLSVDISNTPAVHIYESLGFKTVRELDVIGRFHPNRTSRPDQAF